MYELLILEINPETIQSVTQELTEFLNDGFKIKCTVSNYIIIVRKKKLDGKPPKRVRIEP